MSVDKSLYKSALYRDPIGAHNDGSQYNKQGSNTCLNKPIRGLANQEVNSSADEPDEVTSIVNFCTNSQKQIGHLLNFTIQECSGGNNNIPQGRTFLGSSPVSDPPLLSYDVSRLRNPPVTVNEAETPFQMRNRQALEESKNGETLDLTCMYNPSLSVINEGQCGDLRRVDEMEIPGQDQSIYPYRVNCSDQKPVRNWLVEDRDESKNQVQVSDHVKANTRGGCSAPFCNNDALMPNVHLTHGEDIKVDEDCTSQVQQGSDNISIKSEHACIPVRLQGPGDMFSNVSIDRVKKENNKNDMPLQLIHNQERSGEVSLIVNSDIAYTAAVPVVHVQIHQEQIETFEKDQDVESSQSCDNVKTELEQYLCGECWKPYTREEDMERCMTSHRHDSLVQEPFFGSARGNVFPKAEKLEMHQTSHQSSSGDEDQYIQATSEIDCTPQAMEDDQSDTSLEMKCLKCGKLFLDKVAFAEHVTAVHYNGISQTDDNAIAHQKTSNDSQDGLKNLIEESHDKTNKSRQNTSSSEHTQYGCGACGKQFFRPGNLENHMRYRCAEKRACTACGKHFSEVHSLKKHQLFCKLTAKKRILDGNKNKGDSSKDATRASQSIPKHSRKVRCGKCKKLFPGKEILAKHVKRCNKDKKIMKTGKQNSNRKIGKQNTGGKNIKQKTRGKTIKQKTGGKTSKQKTGGKTIKPKTRRKTIKRTTGGKISKQKGAGGKLACGICKKRFSYHAFLIRHEHDHFAKQSFDYTCRLCCKSFSRVDAILKHQQTCQQTASAVKCVTCSMTFQNKEALAKHKKDSHVCEACGKQFSKCNLLVRHRQSCKKGATGKIHQKCEKCNKVFARKEALEKHKKDSHICASGKESTASSRKKAVGGNEVSLSPKHVCRTCGKEFITQVRLLIHERNHSRRKSLTCNGCGEGFANSELFSKHEKVCELSMVKPSSNALNTNQKSRGAPQIICEKLVYEDYVDIPRQEQERRFACSGCGQSFSSSDQCLKHGGKCPQLMLSDEVTDSHEKVAECTKGEMVCRTNTKIANRSMRNSSKEMSGYIVSRGGTAKHKTNTTERNEEEKVGDETDCNEDTEETDLITLSSDGDPNCVQGLNPANTKTKKKSKPRGKFQCKTCGKSSFKRKSNLTNHEKACSRSGGTCGGGDGRWGGGRELSQEDGAEVNANTTHKVNVIGQVSQGASTNQESSSGAEETGITNKTSDLNAITTGGGRVESERDEIESSDDNVDMEEITLSSDDDNEQNSDTNTTFQCMICGESFNSDGSFADHLQIHKNIIFKCSKCNSAFQGECDWRMHQKTCVVDDDGHGGAQPTADVGRQDMVVIPAAVHTCRSGTKDDRITSHHTNEGTVHTVGGQVSNIGMRGQETTLCFGENEMDISHKVKCQQASTSERRRKEAISGREDEDDDTNDNVTMELITLSSDDDDDDQSTAEASKKDTKQKAKKFSKFWCKSHKMSFDSVGKLAVHTCGKRHKGSKESNRSIQKQFKCSGCGESFSSSYQCLWHGRLCAQWSNQARDINQNAVEDDTQNSILDNNELEDVVEIISNHSDEEDSSATRLVSSTSGVGHSSRDGDGVKSSSIEEDTQNMFTDKDEDEDIIEIISDHSDEEESTAGSLIL